MSTMIETVVYIKMEATTLVRAGVVITCETIAEDLKKGTSILVAHLDIKVEYMEHQII